MRHGKREGDNAPKATPERQGNDNRAKQTDNTNENGTSETLACETLEVHRNHGGQWLMKNSFPGSRRRI